MYETLVKIMRHCVETCDCPACPVDDKVRAKYCITSTFTQAADAIEKLTAADVRPNNTGVWEPSEIYKGYVCCPYCHDCYVEPEWITKMKWKYCPSCGSRLESPEVKE